MVKSRGALKSYTSWLFGVIMSVFRNSLLTGLIATTISSWATLPIPSISINSAQGMSPFTVHVHGLPSTLGAGSAITAKFDWNFGDTANDLERSNPDTGLTYNSNRLRGFNAAHVYSCVGSTPCVFTLTLTVTNEAGEQQ